MVDVIHIKVSYCKQNMLQNRHDERKMKAKMKEKKKGRNESRRLASLNLLVLGIKPSNTSRKDSVVQK